MDTRKPRRGKSKHPQLFGKFWVINLNPMMKVWGGKSGWNIDATNCWSFLGLWYETYLLKCNHDKHVCQVLEPCHTSSVSLLCFNVCFSSLLRQNESFNSKSVTKQVKQYQDWNSSKKKKKHRANLIHAFGFHFCFNRRCLYDTFLSDCKTLFLRSKVRNGIQMADPYHPALRSPSVGVPRTAGQLRGGCTLQSVASTLTCNTPPLCPVLLCLLHCVMLL